MDEFQIKSNLCLVGLVYGSSVIKLEVWLHNYDLDIDLEITDKFTTEQLKKLKLEFLDHYEKQKDQEQDESPEDINERLQDEAEHKMEMMRDLEVS